MKIKIDTIVKLMTKIMKRNCMFNKQFEKNKLMSGNLLKKYFEKVIKYVSNKFNPKTIDILKINEK